MFSTTLGLGSGVTVFKPKAAATLIGQGAAVPSAAVAVMTRGPVGRPFRVTSKTVEAICGKPLSMREGTHAEGLRHVKDALKGSEYVSLVRVAPSDARFPVLSLMKDGDGGNDAVVTTSAEAYGTTVAAPADSWLTVWPINGAPSNDILVKVVITDAPKGRFTIQFGNGPEIAASTKIDDVDDRGFSLYLPSVLDDNDHEYECIVDSTVDLAATGILESVFVGGTNGDVSTLVAQDYIDAWDLLATAESSWLAGFAAGIYDATVLASAYAACESRMAQFCFDAPPWMTEVDAVAWMVANAPKGYLARGHHYSYMATDVDYGGRAIWGVSGTQTANKAKCVALPTNHAAVAGWMFVPAGQSRGAIGRGGVKPVHVAGKASDKELYNARLNTTAEGIYMNDCMSSAPEENDLRLEQVGAVLSAMAYDFSASLDSIRFSPDGATLSALESLANDLTQRYYNSGSLVNPTNPEQVPYVIEITQPESDYWHVSITLKVTGVARRIGIQFSQAK